MSTIDAAIINHITNNSGSGQGPPAEDVLTRYEAVQTTTDFDSEYYEITTELNDRVLAPGNILRLRNKNGEIDSFIMVLFGPPDEGLNYKPNTVLINTHTNEVIKAVIAHSGSASDKELWIQVRYVSEHIEFNYEIYNDTNGIDPEVGIFINEQMSYKTLCTVLRYINYYIPPLQ